MSDKIDVVEHVEVLLKEAKGKAVRLRVGEDLRAQFTAHAGAAYEPNATGGPTYYGVPVSFDTIDPATVIVETEG